MKSYTVNTDTIRAWLFILGSIALIVLSFISMIVAHYKDGYSIKYHRLSYTGIRRDFVHPIRGIHYKRSSHPWILNSSIVIAGIFYIAAFVLLDNLTISIFGSLFSVILILIGFVDISTIYRLHNTVVVLSQPMYVVLMIIIHVHYTNPINIITLVSIIILVVYNLRQKIRQNRQPDLKLNVLSQKLFIYIEAIYFIIFPILII